ncbi:hypothetical protein Rs2_02413 [Raphanus sativus]|nr:hypothetical protein Rs2_02413 [Raphanus sativus]
MWTQLRLSAPTNRKPFKFFTHVINHPQFLEVVGNIWNSQEPLFHSRSALKLFHSKLKNLKSALREINMDMFGDLPSRLQISQQQKLLRKYRQLGNTGTISLVSKSSYIIRSQELSGWDLETGITASTTTFVKHETPRMPFEESLLAMVGFSQI